MKKFDYIIGNPPFGQANATTQKIYTKFVDMGLEHSDNVMFYHPYTTTPNDVKYHNHATYIGPSTSEEFDISIVDIRLHCYKPEQQRMLTHEDIDPLRNYSHDKPYSLGDVNKFNGCYRGICRKDAIERGIVGWTGFYDKKYQYLGRKYVDNEVFIKPSKCGKGIYRVVDNLPRRYIIDASKSKYVFCVNTHLHKPPYGTHHPYSVVIESVPVSEMCAVIVRFDDYDEAQKLKEWFDSDYIQKEIVRMHKIRVGDTSRTWKFGPKQFKALPHWREE